MIFLLWYYPGWPDSSGSFFLLGISHIWLASPWANENASPIVLFVLINRPALAHAFSLAQGEASQIWEMLKRKSSHLNLVTHDNTFLYWCLVSSNVVQSVLAASNVRSENFLRDWRNINLIFYSKNLSSDDFFMT